MCLCEKYTIIVKVINFIGEEEVIKIISTGEILKGYREEKGFKQSDIAKEFGCTAQLISKIERNERSLSDDILEKYFQFFDLSPEEEAAVTFYEDYRAAGIKTKLYIHSLQEKVAELEKENSREKKGRG